MISFKKKKILITGATGGIGSSLVKTYTSLDGEVLATGTNDSKLEKLKKISQVLKQRNLTYLNMKK